MVERGCFDNLVTICAWNNILSRRRGKRWAIWYMRRKQSPSDICTTIPSFDNMQIQR